MSRPIQLLTLAQKQPGTYTAAAPAPIIMDDGLPVGDLAYYEAFLRLYGTLGVQGGSGGTVVTNGQEMSLLGLTLETDKHGKLIDNVDGLGLYRLNQFIYGRDGQRTVSFTASADGAFTTSYVLPLADPDSLRPYDTLLDVLKARPKITLNMDNPNNMISGGTYSSGLQVTGFTADLSGRILNGPIVEPGAKDGAGRSLTPETPTFMRCFDLKKVSITATATGYEIPMPYGDRIYRRIWISQRNSSSYAELSTVITATARVGFNVNGFDWGKSLPLKTLQDYNSQRLLKGAQTMPTGWACLDFADTGRYTDALSTLDRNAGTAKIVADVTSVSNGALWIYTESYKPIPDAALRASQLAIRQAATAA